MTPPEDEAAHATRWLHAELNRVWLLGERCLRRMQAAGLRPPPSHPALAELEAMLLARRLERGGAAAGEDPREVDEALAQAAQALPVLRAAAPLGRMAESLVLRPLELEALVLAAAPQIDAPLADLFQLLRGAPARRGLDLALVALLLGLHREERVALLDAADPERPLLSWRLVQLAAPEAAEGLGSVQHRPLLPTFDLLSVLCGRSGLAPALQRCARLLRAPATLDDLCLDEALLQRVEGLCAQARAAEPGRMAWALLWGPRGVGKAEVAARIAACAGRPLLALDPEAQDGAGEGDGAELLRRAQRDALLRGAVLYLGPLRGAQLALPALLRDYPGMVVLGVESMAPPRLPLPRHRPVQELPLSLPGEPTRLRLWERALPEGLRGEGLDLPLLARAYRLTPGEIGETAREALAVARPGERKVEEAQLRSGIERRLRNEIGELARRVEVTARWEDLVLPQDQLDRAREFISRSRFAQQVFEDWGFGRRLGYGKGMVALFSGPPGTGKTMLAGLIARNLGLDLYLVDLSQVVSKWVGETEKQLGRVFDQAERAHAVLLFDEADSLFGKRTDIQHSNDRYSNLAVNFLLQRLEHYHGVAVLTTNKEAALDEALRRRLSLHLHLDIPEPEERERLWRSFLPPTVPGAAAIQCGVLAREFELSGGYIKNIALRGAFLAASEGGPVTMSILRRAAALELEDLGRLVRRPFGLARGGSSP